MFQIEPYKSIGNIFLESSIPEIETVLGKSELVKVRNEPAYLNAHYDKGIAISYKENSCCFIGLLPFLLPAHQDFNFANKSYDQVMNYFKQFPGNIYIEGEDTSIISEHLGITTYFEEGLNEVGIFSNSYRDDLLEYLELVNR